MQRMQQNDQKLTQLATKKEELTQSNQELATAIAEIKTKIKKQQEYENPVLKQLREHFKALREELGSIALEEEEDNVDIDNMTYEVLSVLNLRNCLN